MRSSWFARVSFALMLVVALASPTVAAETGTVEPSVGASIVAVESVAAPAASTPAFLAGEPGACDRAGARLALANASSASEGLLAQFEITEQSGPAPALGYCSVDCTRCATTSDCQRRGAGKCYPWCP